MQYSKNDGYFTQLMQKTQEKTWNYLENKLWIFSHFENICQRKYRFILKMSNDLS